jgi:hypothetical protein
MNMNRTMRRGTICMLVAAMLSAASLGAPARASDEGDDPQGVPTMIRYAGCALGIGLAKTPQTLAMSLFLCLQMVYDEAMKH